MLTRKTASGGGVILDLSCGDGRNTFFLVEQGFDVYATEITKEIVDLVEARAQQAGMSVDFRVGKNSSLPFDNEFFDCVLACHSCYYIDKGGNFDMNLAEIGRILKPGGWFVGSVVNKNSFIFSGGIEHDDGIITIKKDPYGTRVGYYLRSFVDIKEIEKALSSQFHNFAFGRAHNDYYGIDEDVHWVVCQKRA